MLSVLVNADQDIKVNPGREVTWFGIVTWIQPKKDVKKGQTRMVRPPCRLSVHILTLVHHTVRDLVDLHKAASHRLGEGGQCREQEDVRV